MKSWSRTWFPTNRWQKARVQFKAYLPSLLVEAEERGIARALEVGVTGSPFLLPIYQIHRTVDVRNGPLVLRAAHARFTLSKFHFTAPQVTWRNQDLGLKLIHRVGAGACFSRA
jgi:hypothetical protein